MPRPRFRLRTLMIAVAVVAVVLGGVLEVGRRRARFRQLAGRYTVDELAVDVLMERDPSYVPMVQTANRRLAAYYGRLKAKYRRAARYPWLPVPPDPPPPE